MDLVSDADKRPSCSKSLYKELSKNDIVRNQSAEKDVILIDGDDSCTSDYGTGSALSPSSTSSSMGK